MIKDSGDRTVFESGAVRDMAGGKGRFDLVPLDVLAFFLKDEILSDLAEFKKDSNSEHLLDAFNKFAVRENTTACTLALEVAKHFEDGAAKYGENNWQKGIPNSSYLDSACRHYIKHTRGDKDERHDRAFVWNIMCLCWNCFNENK